MTPRRTLGAPGVYDATLPVHRPLTREPLHACAFVGVAPRGPAHTPRVEATWLPSPRPGRRSVVVPVESWGAYRAVFGGFEGPGRLPYAVAAFFDNGGQRAYVVRIVADVDPLADSDGVARGRIEGVETTAGSPLWLRARDEGRWGNALSASISTRWRQVDLRGADSTASVVVVPRDAALPSGTHLRCHLADASQHVRRIARQLDDPAALGARSRYRLELDHPLPGPPVRLERAEGTLVIAEGEREAERFDGLGFAPEHPRFVGRVLVEDSRLVYPAERARIGGAWQSVRWLDATIRVTVPGPAGGTSAWSGGEDRYGAIRPDHFFSGWLPGDEAPGDGVHALVELPDLGLVAAPDLYVPAPLAAPAPAPEPAEAGSASFAPCRQDPSPPALPSPTPALAGLQMNPATDLDAIVALQSRLVALAEHLRGPVALLDVPPDLSASRIERWRARFDSPFAAAYHPWLRSQRDDDGRDHTVLVNPSCVAAGIIAGKELRHGVFHGPANEIARGVVAAEEGRGGPLADRLHPVGVDVFRLERDGVRLLGARTLSTDPALRQLSVRRTLTMIERTLAKQMRWVVFEPNHPDTWRDVSHRLRAFLRALYRDRALGGASEAEAFFVRCDAALNDRRRQDAGQLVAEVGVALAEPVEYLMLRLVVDADDGVQVEARA